ncbi:MAG: T9SS type A sorting domain-containing protein [Salinivirgaceae bacterium]|nr:T9SS type A sorting domain-containing protein [Salinivirgaceae bacterium]
MKLLRTTLILHFAFLLSINVFAQNSMEQMLKDRGEIVVSIQANDLKTIPQLYSYSVDKVQNNVATLYLNTKQYKVLTDLQIPMKHEASPSMKSGIKMAKSSTEAKEWDSYPDYETYLSMMEQFTIDYPEICTLDTIGYSVENRLLLALKISDNVAVDELEPEFFYSSSMHGDELTGYVLMLRLADYLLSNYNTPEIKNLVDNIEIYINPLANPDGTFAGGNTTVYGATRYNANSIDINRNFKDPKVGDHPDGNSWQVETVAMMDYAQTRNFVLSMNFHGGIELLNYPWDTFSARHADNDWFIYISQEYVDTVHAKDPNYMIDMNNGITNGYDWIEVAGGRQDYFTYFALGREVTAELSTVKLVNASELPELWENNYRSLLNYMEQSLFGLYGTVKNNAGEPLNAKIFIEGHDGDSTHVWTEESGTYYRLLNEGTYSISFSANGYDTKTQNVTITNNNRTHLNVVLENYEERPTVEISTQSTNPTNDSPIQIMVEFSEVVNGFDVSDFSATLGTFDNLQEIIANKKWTADLTIENNGVAYVNIEQDVATNNAGNGNAESSKLLIVFDNTSPVNSLFEVQNITGTSVDLHLKFSENGTFYYAVVFPETLAPSVSEIIAGEGFEFTGSKSMIGNQELVKQVSGLTLETSYVVYALGKDNAGNTSEVYSKNVQTTSIQSHTADMLKVYPNPAKGTLFIKLPVHAQANSVRVYSVSGKVLMNVLDVNQKGESIKLDIHKLKAGIYFVELESEGLTYRSKIVVE